MQTQKHRAEAHLSSTLAHQVDFSDFGDGDGIDSTVIFFCLAACLREQLLSWASWQEQGQIFCHSQLNKHFSVKKAVITSHLGWLFKVKERRHQPMSIQSPPAKSLISS